MLARLGIRLAASLAGVAIGLLLADALLSKLSLNATALVEATIIFWIAHLAVQFLALRVLVRQPSVALAGLLALGSTVVALIIVNLIVSGLTHQRRVHIRARDADHLGDHSGRGHARHARDPLPARAAPRLGLEQLLGDLAQLDLFAALGDAVAAVVAVDVLEGHVAGVADPAAGLHRAVGRLAGEAVGAVVGHRDEVGDLHVVVAVELGRGAAHEPAHELGCRSTAPRAGTGSPWLRHSGLPHTIRSRAHATASSMQKAAAPRLEAAWRMRFSCTKRCASASPRSSSPRIASSPTRTPSSVTSAWSVGMLNVHQ